MKNKEDTLNNKSIEGQKLSEELILHQNFRQEKRATWNNFARINFNKT
jgi:hypothetical protein